MQRDFASVHKLVPNLRAIPYTDTTQYYTTRALTYYFQNDMARCRTYGDSALAFLKPKVEAKPNDAQLLAGYASLLALLDQRQEALRLIDKAVEILPVSKDALSGSDIRNERMIIYMSVGDYDAAIREMQYLLSIPSTVNPAVLRLHPGFDELRNDPRFKKLAEEKVSS
jgi:tetratricopeptide (TPR) repeat protein